jgi:hypothetical protein
MMDWVVNSLLKERRPSNGKWSETKGKIFRKFRKKLKQYLKVEFPGCQVEYDENFDAEFWMFRVLKDSNVHVLKVDRFFGFRGNGVKILIDSKLSKVMKDNEGKQVMVTKEGRLVVL